MATPTTSDLRSLLPEFTNVDEALLERHLASVAAELNEDVFGVTYVDACCYLAAARLASTTFGQSTTTSDSSGQSSYLAQYRMLAMRAQCGVSRVT